MGQQSDIPKPQSHIFMKQLSIKEGIKKFGNKGNDALLKENDTNDKSSIAEKKRRHFL